MTLPSSSPTIDLNCDLGEIDTPEGHAHDLALLDLVTSANIACGAHAGTEATMTQTVTAALARGVSLGAHPSYPDGPNFGRVARDIPPEDVEALFSAQIRALQTMERNGNFGRVALDIPDADLELIVSIQIGALRAIAHRAGAKLRHVKPHGALYHAAMTGPNIARLVANAVWGIDPSLILVGQWGLPGLEIWRSMSDEHHIAAEAFADRCYEANGKLRARTLPNALITDPEAAAAQALQLAKGDAPFGPPHSLPPRTICIHSDTTNATLVARAVRSKLESANIRLAPL